ncbi:GNAT family N-acetyltransferase [Sphingomonas sp.]|uniref:GNAT family N-acetyltransferase n=1 Tax=Sphingomonas sp. TaxID=28214 RepID=UPI001B04AA3F|nr:GNAT family N-acetyltransferase [Sphingomonas sp.]MBO9712394.1 GNAT family N-acetyltransferase [Sphingomonas sp.]
MEIRPATPADARGIWTVLEPIIREGETYALDSAMGEAEALAYWGGPGRSVFVAAEAGRILGTAYVRANQPGPGSHVANAGYAVHPEARGRGLARSLCAHSLEAARAMGFRAMQFNFVVSSNAPAVHLWQAMGFDLVGTLPGAFRHPRLGFVDALVMFRAL